MPYQNQSPDIKKIIPLPSRKLVSVTGPDAMDFLQNITTADMRQVTDDEMIYGLLLTPQGQFLHDFFISRQPAIADAFLVDIFADRLDDFMQRMKMFKLRAKVELRVLEDIQVYAHPSTGLRDPRLPVLGFRLYADHAAENAEMQEDDYIDLCTRHGVPDTASILPQKDFAADMNLDLLGAIAWDKGCYIGQEVTARMHYKGLAKKRLLLLEGKDMAQGDMLFNAGGRVVGEVRQINPRDIEQALAIVRFDSVDGVQTAGGRIVSVYMPPYLEK